jgi:FecR protein
MKSPLKTIVRMAALGGLVWLGVAVRLPAQTNSHVRIVRLSFAEGTVSIQRPDITGWSAAPANTPIQEGFQLSTGKGSFAEVEFENGSTARIGELSLLEFTELSLAPSGGKVNRLAFSRGYATFHVALEPEDVYEVSAGQVKLTPNGKAEFRTDRDGDTLRVEVFKGEVELSGPQGSVTLAKNRVLETSLSTQEAYQVTHGITRDSWDEWVAERDDIEASNRVPSTYSSAAAGTNYGWADLATYGSWSYLPGAGYGWIPSVYAGWSPYSLGRWCWYPAFGYTWISYEPWGWLPYHYGNWLFDPMFGWGWFPGSFGLWSPAQVNWYQGPGWIGWAPTTLPVQAAGGGQATTGVLKGCPGGAGCIKAVPVQALQSGRLVTPTSFMSVDVAKAEPISQPGIRPTPQGRLTGVVLPVAPALGATLGHGGGQAFDDAQRQTGVRPSGSNALAVGGRFNSTPTRTGPTSNGFTRPAPFMGWGHANSNVGVASRPGQGSTSIGANQSSGGFGAASSHSGSLGVSGASSGSAGSGSHSSGGSHH